METGTLLLIFALIIGFYMAWNIGANDVANAIGTSVGSGSLTLRQAVCIAAVLEFCGAYFFGDRVSDTIQSGIVRVEAFTDQPIVLALGMMASLLATGIWLQVASYFGWPVSTTHSIIGAIAGFGIICGGMEAVLWRKIATIGISWIISPLMGGVLSFVLFSILRKYIFYSTHPALAAKRLTPWIVMLFFFTMSFVLIFQREQPFGAHPSLLRSLLLSGSIAVVASLISFGLLKFTEIKPLPAEARQFQDPQVSVRLEKAIKHLNRIKTISSGEFQEQINLRIDELQVLSRQLVFQGNSDHHQEESCQVERIFSCLQIISACFMAFSHGANDVANAIGPLSAIINILCNPNTFSESWLLAWGGLGIVIGLATWGWRVIETVGKKITELTPTRGFAAEFGCATTVMLASQFGLPISTTHTLVGSIFGVGLARGIGALNLSTIRNIIVSWIVTIPAGALLSVLLFFILKSLVLN